MAADRDPGNGEREGEVDEDQHHRLAHQGSGREVLEDEQRADKAEDRTRTLRR